MVPAGMENILTSVKISWEAGSVQVAVRSARLNTE